MIFINWHYSNPYKLLVGLKWQHKVSYSLVYLVKLLLSMTNCLITIIIIYI